MVHAKDWMRDNVSEPLDLARVRRVLILANREYALHP